MEPGFHILEHPADVGIEATGVDLKDAFRQAALGMVSVIVDPLTISPSVTKEIIIDGIDAENLLVRWLSEILFLYDGEDFLVGEIRFDEFAPTLLKALVKGEAVSAVKHLLRTDVKAVTYHQVHVSQNAEGATVRVFLDI
jgi:SHS2 domain-containing protein